MNEILLPTGWLSSWGIHVERRLAPPSRAFMKGATWKFTLHTTETPETSLDGIIRQFIGGIDTPHYVLGKRPGDKHYTCVQMQRLDLIGAALEHPRGTMETNGARCIQMEICGNAKDSPNWSQDKIDAVAAVICLTSHRVPIAHRIPRKFTTTPNRYTQRGWIRAGGINGHQHAASQVRFNHWDPGNVSESRLLKSIERINH